MPHLGVRVDYKFIFSVFLLVFSYGQLSTALSEEYSLDAGGSSSVRYDIVRQDHGRQRRDAAAEVKNVTVSLVVPASLNKTNAVNPGPPNVTSEPSASVTQTPLLGVNGSGILHVNLTDKNTPKVSDPIVPDDNFFTNVYEPLERIKAENNMSKLQYDEHVFYNSSFIGNLDFFNEHWANITIKKATVHSVLSNSHRRATAFHLSFDFPFYGHNIRNVTVATGGFIYTGEHVHNWLAATQYIAPLMANFDTSLTNESLIKLYDDGERFTAFWENVTLQEDASKAFTFAVTLYKNGDITFAYKNIPFDVQQINDTDHPVKVGISDAYVTDKILFNIRRKTIYEYHKVSFKNHSIASNTLLKLVALPTCLPYDTCDSCVNHLPGLNCSWCPQLQKCSSGIDRNKQDWSLRRCDKMTITNSSGCAPNKDVAADRAGAVATNKTAYATDQQNTSQQETIVKTVDDKVPVSLSRDASLPVPPERRSTIGSVVVSIVAVTLVLSAVAWVFYAFRNPHTRSGQILIKYRPSQWNWRRGEARYTAATIHM